MLPFAEIGFAEATWVMIVKSLVIFAVIFGVQPVLTVVERKLIGRFQHRYGPNRVGPFGILQPLADVGKLISKESFRPANAIPTLFVLGPLTRGKFWEIEAVPDIRVQAAQMAERLIKGELHVAAHRQG